MPRNRLERRAEDLKAMEVLAAHSEPIMGIVGEVIAEVEPGHLGLPSCAQDVRLVLDIARRLDDAIPTPDPVETWDGLLWTVVAGVALGIYRRSYRKGAGLVPVKVEGWVQRAVRDAEARLLEAQPVAEPKKAPKPKRS